MIQIPALPLDRFQGVTSLDGLVRNGLELLATFRCPFFHKLGILARKSCL